MVDRKVHTCLWFDREGEDAAKFYCSLVPNSRVTEVSRYGPGMPLPEGTAMMTMFELGGVQFGALNGGPMFKHSEAASIVVPCETQAEIDTLWSGLTADGGAESMCGWLKDRYGVSWQIVPHALEKLMAGGDKAGLQRMMAKMMTMKKLDIAQLEAAYKGH